MSLLKVNNLNVSIALNGMQTPIVRDLSFTIEHGKTLAIVGESGCGKTMTALSLLRLLPNYLRPKLSGEILFQGENLLRKSESHMRSLRGSKIAMIFQDPSSCLNPVMTIGEQLLEAIDCHIPASLEKGRALAIQALQEVGIGSAEERLNSYPHELSGGMKQRVMIAMALLCKPDLLIADEPTTALDVTIQAQILELFRELQKKHNMAIILITHDMGVVAEMADDVLVMYATEAVETAKVQHLFTRPMHPYTVGLFNSLPNDTVPLTAIPGTVPPVQNLPQGCHFHPRCPKVFSLCLDGHVPLYTENGCKVRCHLYKDSKE